MLDPDHYLYRIFGTCLADDTHNVCCLEAKSSMPDELINCTTVLSN